MTPETSPAQEAATGLTIGELARRTGLTPAVLRTWEARHGFPRPRRLGSGHRRYDEHDVAAVTAVLRRQEAGVRLESAIAQVVAAGPGAPSVFAELRRLHPELAAQRLRKRTLVAMSHAVEDECFAGADRAVVFGAFQHADTYRPAAARWRELARSSRGVLVFAEFGPDGGGGAPGTPARVPLAADAPMRREWAVVVDGAELPACLSAWELPGQGGVADGDREFETLWTLDPRAVRAASRVCVRVAEAAGQAGAGDLLAGLDDQLVPGPGHLARATALFHRLAGYLDQMNR